MAGSTDVPFDECRYLTFLYYDLVDSTRMAQTLDEESWRELLREFQHCCVEVIVRHGGKIHDTQGDGSLAYFGYPATERVSAVQAIRTALALVGGADAVFEVCNRRLRAAGLDPVRLRIGIHSGRVVIGAIDGRCTATGFALAFTERLHRCAAPNSVILGSDTLELVGRRFEVECLGEQRLKGIEQPARCYRVLGENDDRLAMRAPFIGRTAELEWLRDTWRSVGTGPPRVVLVAGEAGIGKSRLIREFRHAIEPGSFFRCSWHCQPEMRQNAFHPPIQAVQRRMQRPAVRSLDNPLDRLEAILPPTIDRSRAVPAAAHLLGIPYRERYADRFPSGEARRQAVLEWLIDSIVYESHRARLLLIVEDAQWIDASTLECLQRLTGRADAGPLLLLLVQRTDTSRSWVCPLAAQRLELGRLSASDAQTLVRALPGGRKLDVPSLDRVLERADGVPLYIEESALLEIDHQPSNPASLLSATTLPAVQASLPPRLTDLLTERLDRIGEARESAGLAAAIGRDFPLTLLEAASPLSQSTVREHVQSLVDAGLVQRRDAGEEVVGRFKHALVRDSAYAMLLDSRRRGYHARIASVLEDAATDEMPAPPDRLALHYEAAGHVQRAFELWMLAGVQARRRSEQVEAISHFRRAEQQLALLPVDECAHDRHALELHLALLRCHVALEGYSSRNVGQHAIRAEKLALHCGTPQQLMNARFGLAMWLFVGGRIDEAWRLAEDCRHRAETALGRLHTTTDDRVRNPLLLDVARANCTCGNIDFHLGRFDRALSRLDHCLELCHGLELLLKYVDQDPVVMCLCYRAWYEWERGDPDRAVATVSSAVQLARRNGRAFSMALSFAFHAAIRLFRGEYDKTIEWASNSIGISEASRFATWHAWSLVLRGRALAEQPQRRKEGISNIAEGLRLWERSGAVVTHAFMLAQLAEACLLDRQWARADRAVKLALEIVERHGDRYYEAALRRLQGQLLCASSDRTDTAAARTQLRQAATLAMQRGQYGSALRTAIEGYRLRGDSVACNDLHRALERIHSGLDTLDPRTARSLLHEARFTGTCSS